MQKVKAEPAPVFCWVGAILVDMCHLRDISVSLYRQIYLFFAQPFANTDTPSFRRRLAVLSVPNILRDLSIQISIQL